MNKTSAPSHFRLAAALAIAAVMPFLAFTLLQLKIWTRGMALIFVAIYGLERHALRPGHVYLLKRRMTWCAIACLLGVQPTVLL